MAIQNGAGNAESGSLDFRWCTPKEPFQDLFKRAEIAAGKHFLPHRITTSPVGIKEPKDRFCAANIACKNHERSAEKGLRKGRITGDI